jgi:LPXTG-site transpeptidase (sortase) family protein
MKKFINLIANLNIIIGVILIISPIPIVIYKISAATKQKELLQNSNYETEVLAKTPFQNAQLKKIPTVEDSTNKVESNEVWTPAIPETTATSYNSAIRIPSIGLDTSIYESAYAQFGLDAGIWRMPDQGTPESYDKPMVLAAHRWGLDTYDEAYRTKNLFYKLPDLKAGDQISIMWNGKVYKYQVTEKEENDHVSKMDDLILVTCRDYHSDIRIIVYAKLIN